MPLTHKNGRTTIDPEDLPLDEKINLILAGQKEAAATNDDILTELREINEKLDNLSPNDGEGNGLRVFDLDDN